MISPRTKKRYALVFLVVTGIIIFLITAPNLFFLSNELLNVLVISYVIALIAIMYFMIKNIKAYRKFSLELWRAQAHTPMSALTNKHCPRCNSALYQTFFAEGGLPQMYVCKKCNYAGPIGLELKKIRKARRRKMPRKRERHR